MYLSQAAARNTRTAHKETALSSSERKKTFHTMKHEPGFNSISLFIFNSHWATAALLFVSAISLPFTLTSSQVCAASLWPSALWRSVLFLDWKQSKHTLILPSDSKYFCCALKGMKISIAVRCENMYLRGSKDEVMIYWCIVNAPVWYSTHKAKQLKCSILFLCPFPHPIIFTNPWPRIPGLLVFFHLSRTDLHLVCWVTASI